MATTRMQDIGEHPQTGGAYEVGWLWWLLGPEGNVLALQNKVCGK